MNRGHIHIYCVAAMAKNRVIGVENQIPWHYREDMERFKTLTLGHTVVMGRKTFQSLPDAFRPLPNRRNIVITRDPRILKEAAGVEIWHSPHALLEAVTNGAMQLPTDQLWIIGGAELYRVTMPFWEELYLTVINSNYNGDASFPEFEGEFELVEEDDRGPLSFLRFRRHAATH